jgi:multicomponent Na+:H+ antiporter subunit D
VRAAPAWVLLIASGAVGVIGPIRRAAATAAAALVDRRGYDADVIGRAGRALAAVPGKHPEALAYGLGALSSVLAVVIAALALGVLPRPFAVPRRASRFARRLTLLHSGRIGDYIAWLTAGVGALGGAVALALR